jgi:hypothetical protein
MSKSKNKAYASKRNWGYEDYDDYGADYRANQQKRREKRMRNLIRSKDVSKLVDMDHDDIDDYEERR